MDVVLFHVKSHKMQIATVTINPIKFYFTTKLIWLGLTKMSVLKNARIWILCPRTNLWVLMAHTSSEYVAIAERWEKKFSE